MSIRAISSKRRSDFGDLPSEKIVPHGFFTERELAIFSELIRQFYELPVYHGDYWQCYYCSFNSCDFEGMASHILKVHKSGFWRAEVTLRREFACAMQEDTDLGVMLNG